MLVNAKLMKDIDETFGASEKSRFAYILKEVMDKAIKGEKELKLFVFGTTYYEKGESASEKLKKSLLNLGFEVEVKMDSSTYQLPVKYGYTFLIKW